MRNVFILYMPPGNPEAMVHYQDTIKNRVPQERLKPYLDHNGLDQMRHVFDQRPVAVWGSRDSAANRSRFERMKPGDEILIVEGDNIKLLGRIAYKTVNSRLSRELWKNLRGESSEGWNLVYFIANPREINLPFAEFKQLFHYKPMWSLRGFASVSDNKLAEFYGKYDDLYSVLLTLKQGAQPQPSSLREELLQAEAYTSKCPTPVLDVEEDTEAVVTDHVEMQWRLLTLGLKAGEKVWAPKGDQGRITKAYSFAEFEDTFAAGLDTQTKYVENIDVVWKEEFRIDAAFEVENSTAIYSGLLRFADLTMVAPNSLYPLFVVAPTERKARVLEQLKRPVFRHLKMAEKVRYLSYEGVREIDDFFSNTGSGLNVGVIMGKAEELAVA